MNILYNTIFVNGEAFNCSCTMSLYDLLIYLGFQISSVVVEYNREIINSSKFSSILLVDRDRLEIITIVGGG
uniref:Thiamine biosynthesis protein S n=1 Tax=Sarcopeltis skottsbergii TaxID=2765380 RepID=A0A7M1VHY1_SARSK|nr:thiamine biosynthesis protein S [Sarcopeltis skottsbergii]